MALIERSEKLLLGNDEEGYALAETYEAEILGNKNSGKLFFAIEMPNNPVLAEELGTDIFQCLKDSFYIDVERDPYLRFEDSLKQVNFLLQKKQKEKEFKFISNLNIAVGVIARDNLYLTQAGDSEVYLIRGKYVSVISEGLAEMDSSDELFTNIASGTLEDKDVVLFSSTKLLRYLTEIDLGKIFSNYDLNEALNELKSILKREVVSKIAILALDFKEIEVASDVTSPTSEQISEEKAPTYNKFQVIKDVLKRKMQSVTEWVSKLKEFSFPSLPKHLDTRKKIFLILTIGLFLVLIVSVYALRIRTSEQKKMLKYQTELVTVRENIDRAKIKANLSKRIAGQFLDDAEKSAKEVLNSGYLKAEAGKILEQIQIQRESLDNIRKVTEKEQRVLVDLATKTSAVNALGILPYKDHFAVFSNNALYEILLNKISDPLTIDLNESVVRGTNLSEIGSLVFLTKSGKIIEYLDGIFTFMDTEDKGWHSGVAISSYSDKVYILDIQNNQIWKYKRKRENYSAPDKYIAEGDLTGAVSMAIDGSVFVLKVNGIIDKYYVGKGKAVVIGNEPLVPPSNVKAIYTEKEMDQVYVLDSVKKRVLIYSKILNSDNLNYNMQIFLPNITEELKDLYVDKKAQRLYLLTTSKVYEVEL